MPAPCRHRLTGQDPGFSIRERGFESPWRHSFLTQLSTIPERFSLAVVQTVTSSECHSDDGGSTPPDRTLDIPIFERRTSELENAAVLQTDLAGFDPLVLYHCREGRCPAEAHNLGSAGSIPASATMSMWRNWQTQRSQKPSPGGSIPPMDTNRGSQRSPAGRRTMNKKRR